MKDNKEIEALTALRNKLIAENRCDDVVKITELIIKRKQELVKPCKVYYVDFKAKRLLKVA
jgi:hypothetical protein